MDELIRLCWKRWVEEKRGGSNYGRVFVKTKRESGEVLRVVRGRRVSEEKERGRKESE